MIDELEPTVYYLDTADGWIAWRGWIDSHDGKPVGMTADGAFSVRTKCVGITVDTFGMAQAEGVRKQLEPGHTYELTMDGLTLDGEPVLGVPASE